MLGSSFLSDTFLTSRRPLSASGVTDFARKSWETMRSPAVEPPGSVIKIIWSYSFEKPRNTEANSTEKQEKWIWY